MYPPRVHPPGTSVRAVPPGMVQLHGTVPCSNEALPPWDEATGLVPRGLRPLGLVHVLDSSPTRLRLAVYEIQTINQG